MKVENLEDLYELSPVQQGMLFHSLYAPESGVYIMQLSCTLRGNLSISTFKQAWQRVVDRHSVLRTSLLWEDLEKPIQIVHRRVKLPVEQHDWRWLSVTEQEERLEAYLQADQRSGFKLSEAPLMRLTLIQVAEEAYQFIWTHHHLLLDGWSVSLVLKEVFALYEAFCQGQDLQLKQSRSYGGYIEWIQQQNLSQAEAFWRQELKGFTAPTPLKEDRAFGSSSSEAGRYSEQRIQLSVAATTALQSLVRQHHLTLNTLAQGAWALLLSCYSGEEDVVFGTTVSGRPASLAGVESMVGLLINTLPSRVKVTLETPLLTWLKKLQEQQVEMRQYEYSPLLDIQEWSDVTRGLPLFESALAFENYPVDASLHKALGSLKIENVCWFGSTNYPLSVMLLPGAKLTLCIQYDSSRFEAATIARMQGHYKTLLESFVAAPKQRLSDLPLLTEAERHQLFVEWNETQTNYPKDLCIHQLFEAQVEQTPDATALVFEDKQMTYQQLNCHANQLAAYLQALGVGPEVLVGICMERSLEMIVGLLGILKAGGAYVPLDLAYPKERLSFILEDSQVLLLLTQQRLIERLSECKTRVVCLDTSWETISRESEENPVCKAMATNLAYVIYTSGSMGKPKGTLVPHQGLVNYLTWCTQAYTVEAGQGAPVHSSISFDLTITALFAPLLVGCRVQLLPQDLGIGTLSAVLRNGINFSLIKITPAHLELLSHQFSPQEAVGRTRAFIIGGESLLAEKITFWQDSAPNTMLVNEYGPTETVVGCCVYKVPKGRHQSGPIPIGRPIANTQIYLLDRHLRPVPIGVPGELYIGGVGLTRGYLNRPELTAEKFIPNFFTNEPGVRLYKTGDLACYLPDGNIEFLGRIDHQVKIRGFRIELGEIEAVLAQHPSVRESVVMTREEAFSQRHLVAYVVPNQKQFPPLHELRRFLKQKLPDYMVPSTFVLLDALPLTPNGKLDSRALPVPNGARPDLVNSFVSPRTPTEEMLTEIWVQVLGVKQVGIYDDFFELGGNSLLATQLISRVRKVFQIELSLRSFFQAPSVAELAVTIEQIQVQDEEGDDLAHMLEELEQLPEDEVKKKLKVISDERSF